MYVKLYEANCMNSYNKAAREFPQEVRHII